MLAMAALQQCDPVAMLVLHEAHDSAFDVRTFPHRNRVQAMDDPQQTHPRQINDDPLGAFCRDSAAFLPGAADGPLAGLTFATKDLFDVAGPVTGGGNPDWEARRSDEHTSELQSLMR